eukprot:5490609-Prymnesium_polylepis.1
MPGAFRRLRAFRRETQPSAPQAEAKAARLAPARCRLRRGSAAARGELCRAVPRDHDRQRVHLSHASQP